MHCHSYVYLLVVALTCRLSVQEEAVEEEEEELKPYNGLDGLYEEPATWVAGKNSFPSTLEEMRRLLGVKPRKSSSNQRVKVISDVKLPKSFDAREQWSECATIKDITEQGDCGSCWAVSAANSFSDRLCIASKGNISVSLSYHQLTTCCFRCGYGCGGGLPELAWDYFYRHGLVTGGSYLSKEGCQPYNVSHDLECYDKKCTNTYYSKPYGKDLHKTSVPIVLDNDEETIKAEIFRNGPVGACFEVFSDLFSYTSGVYKRTATAWYEGGHAIRIIGWGEENGLKYWLCANSWGTSWGINGLFKILRGSNECQIEDRITVGKPIV